MKNKIRLVVLAVFVGLTAVGMARQSDRCAGALAELTAGVEAIDVGGGALPGGFILAGKNAFAIARCRNYNGTAAVAAAGAFYGEGRAVFLSHPAYLRGGEILHQTATFIKNSVRWTARGAKTPAIAALGDASIERFIKGLGFTNVKTVKSVAEAEGSAVLVANDIPPGEVDKVLEFVKAGGGFINGMLGWGFMWYKPTACFAEEFTPNRVAGQMGVLIGVSGVNRIDGSFPVVRGAHTRGIFVDEAFDMVLNGEKLSDSELKQAVTTLSQLATALPSSVRPDLHSRLAKLADHPDADKVPSPESPVGPESLFARIAIVARKNAWIANPENPVAAEKGAAVYPGLVAPGTPSIVKKVEIDLAVPRWHSTGVFAVAGKPLTVKISADAVKLGLKARIGTTADDLSALGEWKRHPLVTCEVPLVKESTTLYNPFGGLVYITVPFGAKTAARTDVEISGGVMAPWFRLGRDTRESFLEQCRSTGAPYGEIQGAEFIVTSDIESLKKVDDPEWIARYWDKVLKSARDLAQWKSRSYPERMCSDVQLTAGFMHSGYPLMTHVNEERYDWAVDRFRLEWGAAWGNYHEIGHNHQNRDWTPDGTGEVTVNLFTVHAIEAVTGADVREARFQCGALVSQYRISRWVAKGRRFSDWKQDPFLALEMYLRIKEAYGWDVYKKTFARYLEPGFARPKNDAEKWSVFAKEISRAAGVNLAAAMAAWSIPLDAETLKACSVYPAAAASVTEGLQVTADTK